MTALLMRWHVIPANFVVFCNRSNFVIPGDHILPTVKNGKRITTITEDTRETTFLFQRLSMALQRGNAVSFHNTVVTE